MRLDQHKNPIYNSNDIFDLLYQGKLEMLSTILVDFDKSLEQLEAISGIKFQTFSPDIMSTEQYDKINQKEWFMPPDYCPDLIENLYKLCTTQEQIDRVNEEMEEFIKRDMMDLLFFLKYLVDTLKENKIVWGVGRGSSVASYVLFLIGVHQIDSMKYNLDWREFLR